MEIAILYICTGKYSVFWESFYSTCQQFFYPNAEKTYFVFTDDEELIKSFKRKANIHPYFQRRAGWPYDTLMRFNSFASVQDLLSAYDYCYFWNANAVFLKTVDESVIPLPNDDKELVLWRHTYDYDKKHPEEFDAETNPESEAYIPAGATCYSYGGGFFGGTPEGFVRMSIVLRDRIARDLENGIIAVAHDQSHIVRYGSEIGCVEVPRNTIVSEEYMEDRNPYVIFANKQKYGGMYMLRDMPFAFRFRKWLYNLCCSFLDMIGMKIIVKSIIGKK